MWEVQLSWLGFLFRSVTSERSRHFESCASAASMLGLLAFADLGTCGNVEVSNLVRAQPSKPKRSTVSRPVCLQSRYLAIIYISQPLSPYCGRAGLGATNEVGLQTELPAGKARNSVAPVFLSFSGLCGFKVDYLLRRRRESTASVKVSTQWVTRSLVELKDSSSQAREHPRPMPNRGDIVDLEGRRFQHRVRLRVRSLFSHCHTGFRLQIMMVLNEKP